MACEESEEEKEQDRVCGVRADIEKRVDDLAALTITTASIEDVTNSLTAIRDDLETIAAEREELAPEQRDAVDQAAKRFRSELETAAKDVVSGAASGEEAGARVGAALGRPCDVISRGVRAGRLQLEALQNLIRESG